MKRATSWSSAAVGDLLRAEFDSAVTDPTWLGSGQWSDCFAFASGEADLVVRLGRHVDDFRKDLVAHRYARPTLPIPAVTTIGRAGSDWFVISERVFGEPLERSDDWGTLIDPVVDLLDTLRHTSIDDSSGWGRWAVTDQGLSVQAPAANWRTFLLEVDRDTPGGRVSGWKNRLANWPRIHDQFDEGYRRLQAIASNEVPRSLVHNDLINRNTLVASNEIAGVFDWGNSLFGDHLYDLAPFCFWQPWLPQLQDRAVLNGLRQRWAKPNNGVPDFGSRFETCLVHIGLEHIAYHAFLNNRSEAAAVGNRLDQVVTIEW